LFLESSIAFSSFAGSIDLYFDPIVHGGVWALDVAEDLCLEEYCVSHYQIFL
jgi:hypothetical protein